MLKLPITMVLWHVPSVWMCLTCPFPISGVRVTPLMKSEKLLGSPYCFMPHYSGGQVRGHAWQVEGTRYCSLKAVGSSHVKKRDKEKSKRGLA